MRDGLSVAVAGAVRPARRRALRGLAALPLAAAGLARAQFDPDPTAVDGKDVMWVPTPEAAVERMLQMAQVGPRDMVVDLGSGDGRVAIMAAKKFGARARGIEYSESMIEVSRRIAAQEGVADRVSFRQADIFDSDFGDATVLTLYLLTGLNVKLRPKILQLAPGTRVVSHQFRMGDWEPDEQAKVGASDLYLWIVPARVAGMWRLVAGERAVEVELQQSYQRVTGAVRDARGSRPVAARLRGDELSLAFDDADGTWRTLSGRVVQDRLEGRDWRAVRVR